MMNEEELNFFVETYLENDTFTSLLEIFDLTPNEVFIKLFEEGMIDQDILDDLRSF